MTTGLRGRGDDDPVLPEQTSDDLDAGWDAPPDPESDDERLLRDRPPHWEE